VKAEKPHRGVSRPPTAPITLKQLEAAFGSPAPSWAGRCYAVACAAADLIEDAAPIYGHWVGPVSSKSIFAGRSLFVQHGWVLLPDGRVLDPTRWEFEGRAPYIYVGPDDHYDEGGNKFRQAMMGPPPSFDSGSKVFDVTADVLPSDAWSFVEKLLRLEDSPLGQVTYEQVHWLANLDPRQMDGHARAILKMLEHFDMLAHMPIDNQDMIENGRVR
jgi:hypothetical protein